MEKLGHEVTANRSMKTTAIHHKALLDAREA
jgi:hypothetical protein